MTDKRSAVVINRSTYWNIACPIRKGGHEEFRGRGIRALQNDVAGLLPFLADHVGELTSFEDVRFLDVHVNRLPRWHLPGLLVIGDAAHAMSPMGGVGINLAVQDAVAAANLLAEPLTRAQLRGTAIPESVTAAVQRRRWVPTATTQALQRLVQRHAVERTLRGGVTPDYHWILPSRLAQNTIGRLVGVGVRPEHLRIPLTATSRRALVREP